VEIYSLQLLFLWLIPLWLLGWLMLPFARRLFPHLPDGGLAAGRVLGLLLLSLLAFWSAALHLISLRFAPLLFSGIPLACGLPALFRSISTRSRRAEFSDWLHSRRRALLACELVFLGAFLFFALLRMAHPAIDEFEKPMDCAIIGALARADFLPAENPWFAGMSFTNYYYFGHFMGALLTRSFATPLPYAYNLVQPAFCALFLAVFWSLCAAVCRSLKRGILVMGMVALCGNFEPLRQWLFSPPGLNRSAAFPFLDWWSTSRVIPNTINEYPLFTLALGDAHAHFFALAFTSLILCTSYELFAGAASAPPGRPSRRRVLLIGGLIAELGALVMTNMWDFPVYLLIGLVCLACGGLQLGSSARHRFIEIFALLLCPFLIALPFLLLYKSQTGGFALEFWLPESHPFLLIWGAFLFLWALGLLLNAPSTAQKRLAALALVLLAGGIAVREVLFAAQIVLLITSLLAFWRRFRVVEDALRSDRNAIFIPLLAVCGLIPLLVPCLGYLNGYFGGALRHQDTVFKFGLQSWMLLGTASLAAVFKSLPGATNGGRSPWKFARPLLALIALCWLVPLCGALGVLHARADFMQDRRPNPLSLNGAAFLPSADQKAISWLARHASRDSLLIEPVGRGADGAFVAAYGRFGLISTLCGVSAYIGWPQHAGFWGAAPSDIQRRLLWVESFYQGTASVLPPEITNPRRIIYCYSSATLGEISDVSQLRPFHARLLFRSGNAAVWKIEPGKG
jgi:YYY domain-containing protein